MPYLKMLRGERYVLVATGDVPGAVWTRESPVARVNIPAKVIQRLGLLEQTAPTFNRQGDIIGEGPRFELLEKLPEDGDLDASARLAALAAEEDAAEGDGKPPKGKPPKGKPAPTAADPTQVE